MFGANSVTLDNSSVVQFAEKTAELRQQLRLGKIDKQQFDEAFTAEQLKLVTADATGQTQQTGQAAAPAAPTEKPTLPESDLTKYKARLKELSDAFAASLITADEFEQGIAGLKLDLQQAKASCAIGV